MSILSSKSTESWSSTDEQPFLCLFTSLGPCVSHVGAKRMLLLAKFSVQRGNRKSQDSVTNSLLSVEYLIPYSTLNGAKQLVLFVTALLISKGFTMEPSEGLSPGSQAAPRHPGGCCGSRHISCGAAWVVT